MKAAIYTRVSTSMQAEEGFSLEAQQDSLMQILERKNLELYRVYTDPGVSGKTFKRPGVQAMLTDMKAKRFDALLIHKLDRLSRSMGDLIAFIELVNKLDIRLIIAAQGQDEIDTRSPMGKAFLQLNGIWSELYLNNLREETLKGLTKKAQNGGKHISRPPLGYTFDENHNLIIVEEEAKLVREVYRLFLNDHWGVTKIAKHMNEHSTTKEGGKWDNKNVRNILTSPTYAGYNHFKPEEWAEDSRIMTDGKHEPIVSRDEFQRAKDFRKRRGEGHMSRRSFDYPYSGIVRCARCGATYTGNSSNNNGRLYRSYRCLNQYAKNTCDAPGISERMLNDLVFKHVQIIEVGYQEAAKQKKKSKVNVNKEAELNIRRKKNWLMALGDGKMSGTDYAAAMEAEEARMKEIFAELEDNTSESVVPLSEIKEMMKTIHRDWDMLETLTQKQMIQSMFRKIVINKKDGWEIVDFLTV